MISQLSLRPFSSLRKAEQQVVAEKVARLTQGTPEEHPQMLPKTPSQLMSRRVAVVATMAGQFAGYVSADDPMPNAGDEMVEVGTLVVPAEFRRIRIASRLVLALSWKLVLEDKTPFAFCNPQSLRLFEQSGYRTARQGEIPLAAFGLCASCPAKPKDTGCCDTPVVFDLGGFSV